MKHFVFTNIEGDHYVQSINLVEGAPAPIPRDPNIRDFVGVATSMGYTAPTQIAWEIYEEYYSWRQENRKRPASDSRKSPDMTTLDAA
jgi:hypothetical protein